MLKTPEIIDVPAQPTAVIRLTIPRDEIRDVMDPDVFDFEIAVAGATGMALQVNITRPTTVTIGGSR